MPSPRVTASAQDPKTHVYMCGLKGMESGFAECFQELGLGGGGTCATRRGIGLGIVCPKLTFSVSLPDSVRRTRWRPKAWSTPSS